MRHGILVVAIVCSALLGSASVHASRGLLQREEKGSRSVDAGMVAIRRDGHGGAELRLSGGNRVALGGRDRVGVRTYAIRPYHAIRSYWKARATDPSFDRTPRHLARRAANAPAGVTAQALRLPNTGYTPATVDPSYDRVESNAQADQDVFGKQQGVHSKTYEELGRVTGYYQKATWQPSGATEAAAYRYQGSIFTSAAAAQAAWNDGVTTTRGSLSSSDCSSAVGMPCAEVAFVTTDTKRHFRYYFLQKNQCLAETEFDFSDALFTSSDNQIEQIGANIAGNAAAVLKTACTSVDFKIVSVRVEKNGAKADWKQVKTPLKQIKVGGKVQLSVYFLVNSAPPSAPYAVHWTVTQGGRTLLDQDFNKNTLCPSASCSDTDPSGTYRDVVRPLTLKQAGQVQVVGKLTISDQTKQASTTLKVAKKNVAPPPPPPPASFSFDKVVAMDASGHARSTFGVGQTVTIVATYTVRNLRPGAILPGTVNGSYLIPVKGKFQTGGVYHDQIVATRNGVAVHRHTTVGGFSFATPIHVLVRIALGRIFQEKQIAIQVK